MKRASKEEYIERLGKLRLEKPQSGSSLPTLGTSASTALDAAYGAIGRLIIKDLATAPDQTNSVFRLLESLDMSAEDILPVIRWLEKQDLVHVLDRPRTGDWKLQPSPLGQDFISGKKA